jgi:hypothetical protein
MDSDDDEDEAMEGDDGGGDDDFYVDDCGHEEDPVRRERPLEFSVSHGERRRSQHKSVVVSID